MNTSDKTAYIIAGVIVAVLFFYGFYILANLDSRLDIEKESQAEDKQGSSKKIIIGEFITAGLSNCFQAGMEYENGRQVSCELSGTAFFNNQLLFVSNKDIPGYPPYFITPYRIPLNLQNRRFLGNTTVRRAKSFEAIALSPDQKYIFLTTSFEKSPAAGNKAFSANNRLLYMPSRNLDTALIAPDNTLRALHELRKNIQTALKSKLFPKGPPYFKIEGLALRSDSSMMLGISKTGAAARNAKPTAVILEADYYITHDGRLLLTSSFRESYRLRFDNYPNLEKNLFLSGLEYDRYNDAVYILTAYKNGPRAKDAGGYLWHLSTEDYLLHRPANLVYRAPKVPLEFAHLPSGITTVDDEKIIIICNDGRILGEEIIKDARKEFHRELNQAGYYSVKINR